MDSETAEDIKRHFDVVINGLRTEFEGLRTELRSEVGSLRSELHTDVGSLRSEFGSLRSEFGSLRSEFGGLRFEFAGLRSEFGDVRSEVADVKRHGDVVTESLRSDIRTVAEGVVGLDEKFTREFERFRGEMAEQFAEVKGLLRVSYGDLDRRVQSLEKRPPS